MFVLAVRLSPPVAIPRIELADRILPVEHDEATLRGIRVQAEVVRALQLLFESARGGHAAAAEFAVRVGIVVKPKGLGDEFL